MRVMGRELQLVHLRLIGGSKLLHLCVTPLTDEQDADIKQTGTGS